MRSIFVLIQLLCPLPLLSAAEQEGPSLHFFGLQGKPISRAWHMEITRDAWELLLPEPFVVEGIWKREHFHHYPQERHG